MGPKDTHPPQLRQDQSVVPRQQTAFRRYFRVRLTSRISPVRNPVTALPLTGERLTFDINRVTNAVNGYRLVNHRNRAIAANGVAEVV